MPNWKKVIVQGSDATLNTVTASNGINALNSGFIVEESTDTELEVQGTITASGHLFASLSFDNTPVTDGVVVYDTANGQLFFTGSYGGAGGGGGLQFETVSAVPNGGGAVSPDIPDNTLEFSGSGGVTTTVNLENNIVTVGIDGSNIDDDWLISGDPNAGLSFVSSSRAVLIGPSGSTELKFGGNATHNLSLGIFDNANDPNHIDANGTTTLGLGLSSSVNNETIVGRFNDDSNDGKLFSIGNGHAFNDRRNIALYRSKSIDFSPNGLVLEDYFIQSEGGNLLPITPTTDVPAEEFVVEFIFSNYNGSGGDLNTTFTNTGNANNIGVLTGFTALQDAIDAKVAAGFGVGPGQLISLEVLKIRLIGDFDGPPQTDEDLRNLEIGDQTLISVLHQDATQTNIEQDFKDIWTGSLATYNQYFGGNDDASDVLDGIINDANDKYIIGGNPTNIDAGPSDGTSPGITFNADFGIGVGSFSGTSNTLAGVSTGGDPAFQITFRVPAYTINEPTQTIFPKGVGLFVGEERLRPGGTLSTTLGSENHGVVITNINTESSDDETSGLRIIVGDHNDNTNLGIDLGNLQGTDTSGVGINNFITFDAKNASETYGYERMGFIACASGTGQPLQIFSQSDKRLKENIKLTKKGISLIKDIKVRDFNWKNSPNNTVTGFVAQELYKVIPEAVKKGGTNPKTNPWTVNYQALIPHMVKAIQEQQKLIEDLQKQIDQLK
jgi:hypothetical protein